MQGAGYLAIWSDLTPQDETDWAHWITREHAAERVGVSGFLACRIFRALGASVNRYFILYELEDERVVGGADYLARLNAPTPWSQRTMPKLGNFARGGGRIAASAGIGQGGIVAPLRLDAAPAWDAAAVVAEQAAARRCAPCGAPSPEATKATPRAGPDPRATFDEKQNGCYQPQQQPLSHALGLRSSSRDCCRNSAN